MWEAVQKAFKDLPAQRKVAKLMLERGYRLKDGHICSGSIKLPYTEISRELEVDRRVVDSAAETIEKDPELEKIFSNLQSHVFLAEIAPVLGLGVVVIEAEDPLAKGLLGEVATCIAENDLSIYQAVADDPTLKEEPRMTVVTEKKPSGNLVSKLSGIDGVAKLTIY